MKDKRNSKAIKNTSIPIDWEFIELGKVCNKFINGGTPSTTVKEYWNGKIPWITGADIFEQRISEVRRFITEKAVKNSSTNIVPKGSLLFVTRTGVGKLTITPFDLAISQDLTGLLLKDKMIDSLFAFYFFDSIGNRLKQLNQGTSINGITREVLQTIKLPLPSLPEQKAIAHILSLMDSAITLNNQLIAQKDLHKKWLMQNLLSGRKRLKGFDNEWKTITIGDTFRIIRSYPISREGLTTNNEKNSINCIHYGDIHALYENSLLDFNSQQSIPQIIDINYTIKKNDLLKEGDIIMADASEDYEGLGELVEVINLNQKKAVGGLHTIVLRGNPNIIANKYRGYLLSSEVIRNILRKMATGTSVYSVTKTTLIKLPITIPNEIKEQIAISELLWLADQEIQLLKLRNDRFRDQKKGLMQVLLTGKKRITNVKINT